MLQAVQWFALFICAEDMFTHVDGHFFQLCFI